MLSDAEDATTADVVNAMFRNQQYEQSPFGRVDAILKRQGAALAGASPFNPLNMLLAAAQSANRWLGALWFPERVEMEDVLVPPGAGVMAAPFARIPATLASRNAMIHDPPARPQRPFEADYPGGARADDAGRLTHDIEGRPLIAETVVGRRVVGGEDEAFPPAQLDAFTEKATGSPSKSVAGNTISGEAGRLVKDTDRRSGNRTYEVLINRGLPPQQAVRVVAHENAHIIDEIAGQIPTEGLIKELRQVYHDLNDPTWRRGQTTKPSLQTTPEQFGYRSGETPREYMAEAIRAYLTNPNYLKTVAPKTAAAIRKHVNAHHELSRLIQFNADVAYASVPGTVIYRHDRRSRSGERGELPQCCGALDCQQAERAPQP